MSMDSSGKFMRGHTKEAKYIGEGGETKIHKKMTDFCHVFFLMGGGKQVPVGESPTRALFMNTNAKAQL